MEIISKNQLASGGQRLGAFIIDRIILSIGLSILVYHLLGRDYEFSMYSFRHFFSGDQLLVELIMMAYFVYFESSAKQATLGKQLFSIKVVNRQYQRITVEKAIIRHLSKYLSAFILGLGYIWIIFDPEKQGWHDKIADTLVVETQAIL